MTSNSSVSYSLDQSFIDRLKQVYGIEQSLAERLTEEFLIFYSQNVEEWVRSRHYHLQRQGYKNTEIYSIIATELKMRRFSSNPLTTRQIRRLIYG